MQGKQLHVILFLVFNPQKFEREKNMTENLERKQ